MVNFIPKSLQMGFSETQFALNRRTEAGSYRWEVFKSSYSNPTYPWVYSQIKLAVDKEEGIFI